MKTMFVIVLGLCLGAGVLAAADDEKKPAAPEPEKSKPAEKQDPQDKPDKKNEEKPEEKPDPSNTSTNADRGAAVRAALLKERQAREKELLLKYDKNGDGKLDAEERMAARLEFRKSARRPSPEPAKEAVPPKEDKK